MKFKIFLILILGLLLLACDGSSHKQSDSAAYQSLDDGNNLISFDGTKVQWGGHEWVLGSHTIFIDYRLSDSQLAQSPYVFKSLQAAKAAGAIVGGTIDERMKVLVAPGVYWVDDPDDGFIRPERPVDNPEEDLYGMTISADWLHIIGLNSNKFNVVFAAARGQQQGSDGNFNLLRINSVGLMTENVTFGNYTNVDLNFPLDAQLPENKKLSRAKRFDAISQAQLFGGSNVTNAIAINTAFISRLNLAPFKALYINCYMETTGHSGGGSTYINSKIYLYGLNFSGGTQFYNSDIYLEPLPVSTSAVDVYEQGFGDNANTSGRAFDARIHRGASLINHPLKPNMPAGISWSTRTPKDPTVRSYQYNVTLDGNPYIIQDHFTPGASVVIPESSDLLKAYRIEHEGKVVYNLQNILDLNDFSGNNAVYLPYANVPVISAAESAQGLVDGYYRSIPRTANLSRVGGDTPVRAGAGDGVATFTVQTEENKSAGLGEWTFAAFDYKVNHKDAIDPSTKQYRLASYVKLMVDGASVKVESILTGYEEKTILLVAKNTLGIEAATLVNIQPKYIDPPVFKTGDEPKIILGDDGTAKLEYKFAVEKSGLRDTSVISWYRVDANGNRIPLIVSRSDMPEQEYKISAGDLGAYLEAGITPKYNVSEQSEKTINVKSARAITNNDVKIPADASGKKISSIETNFNNMPVDPQPKIIPGTWTLTDGEGGSGWIWVDGSTTQGAAGFPGLQTSRPDRQSRLHYQPAGKKFGDVKLKLKLAPNKSAGQGFGSAPDFLDIYIKSDGVRGDSIQRGEPGAINAYALRFQRLAAPEIQQLGFDSGGAVVGLAVYLMEIKNGKASAVSYDASGRPFGSTLAQTIWNPEAPAKQYKQGAMISAFASEMSVELGLIDGKLSADISSTKDARAGDAFNYLRQVHLEADVAMTDLGGVGIYYSSSTGSDNSSVLTYWKSEISVEED
ncbi:hypothetical protein [Cellvibrio sp. NN19]|uniref:hypothetical protein n=1 Tax=Cellvibrio chitinivorans TaxID=3102792 RepID=UPI002B40B3F0|nr:hypothetical protein [Cellvibrio sp. NN19]